MTDTVYFKTFGCKLNQTETASIAKDFQDQGYRIVSEIQDADVFVINSCTVTNRSDAKCRQSIRHVMKVNPHATVIIVGCYAQVASEAIARIPGVDYILGTYEKSRVFDYFQRAGKLSYPEIVVTPVDRLQRIDYYGMGFSHQTRAFLKIQDGCNHRCAYCIVPFARGPSRSLPVKDIIQQAKQLVEKGYQEIVLTGVHIGQYGRDFNRHFSLPTLLYQLFQVQEIKRIRITSLDPEDITDELLGVVSGEKRFCRHFHIPLQSGSNAILASMRRRYTITVFREKVEKIITAFGHIGLGTDIIAGFPGETDDLFEETVRFVNGVPFSYLHVFPFSARSGTEAVNLPDQINPQIRAERAIKLRQLGERKKRQFMESWIGQVVDVLLESRNQMGWMGGFSSEYLRIEVPYQDILRRRLVSVKIQEVMRNSVRGEIVDGIIRKTD